MISIDKHIPIPAKYPFRIMQVGDSIFVEGSQASKTRVAASSFGRENNIRFVSRKEGSGVRIWRTS